MAVPVKCDIVVAGGGLAGLSLLYRAIKSGLWHNEKIIVIDRSNKSENDRTWSFWKTGVLDFEEIISHHWTELVFFANNGEKIDLKSGNYSYHSIHSIDFYRHVIPWLRGFENISFIQEDIIEVSSQGGTCRVNTMANTYDCSYVFNSIFEKPQLLRGEQYFLQHFKGIKIKTPSSVPVVQQAYLMDFRTGQENGTTFFYTLPMSSDEIFVEYTIFSKFLLAPEEYDRELRKYITEILHIPHYEILAVEFGAIPMTDHRFKRFDGNIINVGSQGGDTRASTGYTFINTQKTVGKIITSLRTHGHPFFDMENIGLKPQLYDATLLNVLARQRYQGSQIFYDLFSTTPAYLIFSFLDAETSLLDDVQIIKSLKVLPFLQAFIVAVFRRLFPAK